MTVNFSDLTSEQREQMIQTLTKNLIANGIISAQRPIAARSYAEKLAASIIGDGVAEVSGEDSSDTLEEFELKFIIMDADVSQSVRIIDPNYDQHSIVSGLANGDLATTTWHGNGPTYIDVVATGHHVAIVISQEIDGEYEDYSD